MSMHDLLKALEAILERGIVVEPHMSGGSVIRLRRRETWEGAWDDGTTVITPDSSVFTPPTNEGLTW